MRTFLEKEINARGAKNLFTADIQNLEHCQQVIANAIKSLNFFEISKGIEDFVATVEGIYS